MNRVDTLFTTGHSTRPVDEFIEMLKVFEIKQVIDVRTVPRSRHNPQYGKNVLAPYLRNRNINYAHYKDLGGLRKASKESINSGWRNASFRGYADYMQTEEFSAALQKLKKKARERTVAILCAESVPWRCHRSMIADALVQEGWVVRHIMSRRLAKPHTLTSFAKVRNGILYYPSDRSEG